MKHKGNSIKKLILIPFCLALASFTFANEQVIITDEKSYELTKQLYPNAKIITKDNKGLMDEVLKKEGIKTDKPYVRVPKGNRAKSPAQQKSTKSK